VHIFVIISMLDIDCIFQWFIVAWKDWLP